MNARKPLLAIFDNDGTICDTQEVEGRCYAQAIEHVTGLTLLSLDWTNYAEPTSSAMVKELLVGESDSKVQDYERRIKDEFCRLLRLEQPQHPDDFSPLAGAIKFLARLENEMHVAIATGCFDSSAQFKLACCGVDLSRYPHATASDTPKRRDIIPLAARRAGFDLQSVVYFGDAPWDVRVCNALGIPMIGIGRRWQQLGALGVRATFRDYSEADKIIAAVYAIHAIS